LQLLAQRIGVVQVTPHSRGAPPYRRRHSVCDGASHHPAAV